MSCKKCGSKYVVNKWFNLCSKCNNIRLHGSKYGKAIVHKQNEKKPLKTALKKRVVDKGALNKKPKQKKVNKNLLLDELLYKRVFEKSDHKCEECGVDLPTNFRNDDGFIEARYRYSHIIPKSIAPELRHNDDNINNLCIKCHHEWDFGIKTKMKIYIKNQLKFPNYLKSIS
tara:strand:- start:1223 stop:1738 length:516 start_codon:yes stop_codon:yes gene_type:complete